MIGDILQPTHLIFILVVALLVLGPKRLPEVGRSLGRGLRDFKYALSTETPEHDYSPAPEPYTGAQPTHEAPVSEPPAEPTVGHPATGNGATGHGEPSHAAASPDGGESAPAASAPAEHSS